MTARTGPMRIAAPSSPLRREPRSDALLETEALHGEGVTVLGESEGWAEARLALDGYEGFLPSEDLVAGRGEAPTHKIAALRSFVYPGPNIKLPPLTALPFEARVVVREHRGDLARCDVGYLWARHLVEADEPAPDFVAVAERFLGVPYLWGGRTPLGIDCSGLVQIALQAAGQASPRDSGPQERGVGLALDASDRLERGDLVFWRGHVGIMRDGETLLHANGFAMLVTSEPLAEACRRIEASGGGPPTSRRRPPVGRSGGIGSGGAAHSSVRSRASGNPA